MAIQPKENRSKMSGAKQYEKIDENLVFDVGAHMGEDSDFYLKLGYRVVAIEANPVLACRLRERFKKQIEQGVYIIDKAISPSNDEVTFYLNKRRSVQGTIIPTLAARNRRVETDTEEIKVQSVRIGELLRNHGCPKYLKVDIEGADIICLRELCDTHCRPPYISIESSTGAWRDIKA
jgi:FkbM family methyltransferase